MAIKSVIFKILYSFCFGSFALVQSCQLPQNFSTNPRPSFVEPKGHIPIQLSASCFDATKTYWCSFHDAAKTKPSYSPVTISGNTAVCNMPHAYASGRLKVQLLIEQDGISSTNHLTVAHDSDSNTVAAALVAKNPTKVTYDLKWIPNWFDSRNAQHGVKTKPVAVDLTMLYYSFSKKEWLPALVSNNAPNSGHASFFFNMSSISREAQFSFYTFKISQYIDWSSLSKELGVVNLTAKWHSLCFEKTYLEKSQNFRETCKIATIAQFSNEQPSVMSTGSAKEDCKMILDEMEEKLHDFQNSNCPTLFNQAKADTRFAEAVKFISPYLKDATPVMASISVDQNGRSRVADYDKASGVSYNSRLADSMCWNPIGGDVVNIYDYYITNNLLEYKCCNSSKSDQLCVRYHDLTNEKPCSNYSSPGAGYTTGDPNFYTFDGLSYTFNGLGEFWLMRSTPNQKPHRRFQVQGRTGQNGWASIWTGFTFKSSHSSSVVQVETPGKAGLAMDVLVDGVHLRFDDPRLYSQCFPGFVVTATRPSDQSGFIISLSADLAFKLEGGYGIINIYTIAGPDHRGKIEGLMGNFDGDRANDLTSREGNQIPVSSDIVTIHKQFAWSWAISKQESMFTYHQGQSFEAFRDTVFPGYGRKRREAAIKRRSEVNTEFCKGDKACESDFALTGDRQLALSNVEIKEEVLSKMEILRQKIAACPEMKKPSQGFFSTTLGFSTNSVINFGCADGYSLIGAVKARCQSNNTWDIEMPKCVQIDQNH